MNELFQKSIVNHWDLGAFANYRGNKYKFCDVAAIVARYHETWRQCGYEPGFKFAMCGRNSAEWGITYIAAMTYGAVIVPMLTDYTPETMHHLIDHCDAKLFAVDDRIAKKVDFAEMPGLDALLSMDAQPKLLGCRNDKFKAAFDNADATYRSLYPHGITPKDIKYYRQTDPDQLVLISYTSGTTSDPKGVMLPERSLWSNMVFMKGAAYTLRAGDKIVSFLPVGHLFGMTFEFLYSFCCGVEVTFITKPLSPQLMMEAMGEIRPHLIVMVPLLLEKLVQKYFLPDYNKPRLRSMRNLPFVRNYVNRKFREGAIQAFGGRFYEVIVGGAALNPDVESLLKEIQFPFTVGYGMTECAPIITFSDWHNFVRSSCGIAAVNMEVKVDSKDPEKIPGELLTKGMNTMLGYYKNEEATRATLEPDGWLHTGDMAVIDMFGNVFLKGRVKNMLLGPSGQNIYPEEIEMRINHIPYVIESVLVQRAHSKLVALVYPDREAARIDGFKDDEALLKEITSHREELNRRLPAYAHVSSFELQEKEFVKTPKNSIKRFMYK